MMSPWDLVSPQARDSVDPGPFPGSRPSFLPFRCPLGCRLQDPQGPCLQSLPRSRSRSRGVHRRSGLRPPARRSMTPARPGAIHPRCRWSHLQSPGRSLFRRDGWCVALGAAPAAPVGARTLFTRLSRP
ncbi:hypothetical protein NDU88_008556 [Pleurodeles waltl]|uniref:Uncharacterized protein n=1 Tax=Pleurodeles waltl TaxID=8319 RepID=A0AAV7RW36_PLEWA|nr:hypothetical protein NDU88_008556 [Pleurodeles waltl]